MTMPPGFADTIFRSGGTGSAVRAVSVLGAAFKQTWPGTDIVVLQGLGSGGAVKALAAHALDLGLAARPLKPAERSQPLQEVEVAHTPLSKPLDLVVRADAPEPVRALVSFIRSPRGFKILADHGYQPFSTAGRYQARA